MMQQGCKACSIKAIWRRSAAVALGVALLVAAGSLPSAAQDLLDDPLPIHEIQLDAILAPANPAVEIPVHSAPGDNTLSTGLLNPPVGVPTLRWEPVAGATRYTVQVSASAGFAATLVNQNTEATAYTPKEVLADGVYYWRVRAQVGAEWGNFSAPWSFTKDWSASGELLPELLAPVDDPQGLTPLNALTPEIFRWSPISGAAAYLLEISTTDTFNDPNLYKATTLKPYHTPVRQLANNRYYWRVTPLDYRDHAGATSRVFSFVMAWNEIPSLLTPDDDIAARFLPRFTWTAVAGAADYLLEISTQEDFSSIDQSVRTPNPSYTPEKALANNKDYFWRVRAINQQGITGPPTDKRNFRADWVYPPILLSPPDKSINHAYPYFSWTPVAGAERYQIQISFGNGFALLDLIGDETLYNATGYSQPEWKKLVFGGDYFWRVRAVDAQGNFTDWSNEPSFRLVTSPPPNLVYPAPDYVPDAEGMPIHSDPAVAHPVFVWDTTHRWSGLGDPSGGNGPEFFTAPDYYSLTVAADRQFTQIAFAIESAGNAAAPTRVHPLLNLVDGHRYYWKVMPIHDGLPMAEGTVWETRIDRRIAQLPTDTNTVPDLSHPAAGFTSVGSAPVLGWLPVNGATYYTVQVAQARDFSTLVDSADALFVYYVPWQGRRGPMPDGVYWWRVRAMNAQDQPLGDWTASRHFFVAQDLMTGSPFDYQVPISGTLLSEGALYDPALSLVAQGAPTTTAPFDVGQVHIIQDRSQTLFNYNWIIALGADNAIAESVSYGIYLDMNQLENVGGTSDPRGKAIAVDPLYLPEFVIYLDRTGDNILGAWLYEWQSGSWVGYSLGDLGGNAHYDPGSRAIQLVFPYSMITTAAAQFRGAVAATVFSSGPTHSAPVQEVVPAQGAVWNKPMLLSDMLMPLYPFDTPLTNPVVFHELPTLRWRMPNYDSVDGYQLQVARDVNFTEMVETWETFESKTYSLYAPLPAAFHSGKAYNDDESYYWRVRVRHERFDALKPYLFDAGPWSPPMRFKLTSYSVGNPTLSFTSTFTQTAQATPTFLWERVEGAAGYTIEIDNDANMSSPLIKRAIDSNSYTPLDTLADGTYFWRVAMRRSKTVTGQWSPIMTFVKQSLSPVAIRPVGDAVVNAQPTFVWTAVFTNVGELRIATPKYRLQWDEDPNFGSPKSVDTEATAYTPPKGSSLADGTWYWRVAAIDADGRIGPFGPPQTFYKEYLAPQLLVPGQGGSTPDAVGSFEWAPLDGAAYYALEIADNDAFNNPVRVTTESARYIHTDKFDAGEYFWRVRMVDRDRVLGPFVPGRFDSSPGPSGTYHIFTPLVRTR
jgi:hypothetical protein